jgi:hypothetical protein
MDPPTAILQKCPPQHPRHPKLIPTNILDFTWTFTTSKKIWVSDLMASKSNKSLTTNT